MPNTAYAQNQMYDLQCLTPEVYVTTWSFLTNGGSNPVNNLVTGKGASSVTRIGGGAYSVVLDQNDLPRELIATFCTVDSIATLGACVAARAYVANTGLGGTAGSLGVQVYTANTGAALDLAAAAGNRVSITCVWTSSASLVPG
jgi:hypothetical protein